MVEISVFHSSFACGFLFIFFFFISIAFLIKELGTNFRQIIYICRSIQVAKSSFGLKGHSLEHDVAVLCFLTVSLQSCACPSFIFILGLAIKVCEIQ